MRRTRLAYFAIACLAVAFAGGTAIAADVEYQIFINGVRAATHQLSPGWHTITIKGKVSNNVIVTGIDGGFLQSAVNLSDTNDEVLWEEAGTSGTWDSTANASFDGHFPGTLVDGDTEFIAETAYVTPGNWNTKYDAIGADVFDIVATGDFYWSGEESTIDLDAYTDEIGVATLKGSNIGFKMPDSVTGDSTSLEQP
ncbi:hypothetical protein [Lacipirellula sp.]|uniref:hypothetical protein n=1 Tax=Lacipirellula sp. TaxID=2691419 RepID=UPI003D102E6E